MSITAEAVTNPSGKCTAQSAQISKIGEITKSLGASSRLTINNLLIYGKAIACSSIVPLDEVISYSRQFTYAEMMTLLSLLSLPRALAAQASSHRVVANLKKIIEVFYKFYKTGHGV